MDTSEKDFETGIFNYLAANGYATLGPISRMRIRSNTVHFGGADHRTLWSAACRERWQAT
jgi:hypothetical protein